MRFYILILVCIVISCSRKVHQTKAIIQTYNIYKSTFLVAIKMPNNDSQTNKFLPFIDVNLTYIVVSDGVKSFIHILNPDLESNQEISLNSNEIFAYTNCAKGIGISLDESNNVLKAFRLMPYEFRSLANESMNVDKIEMNCKVIESKNLVQMQIYTSKMLPISINLGSCYTFPNSNGIVKMSGINSGVEISALLLKYDKTDFDFNKYEDILKKHENDASLNKFDLFWQ